MYQHRYTNIAIDLLLQINLVYLLEITNDKYPTTAAIGAIAKTTKELLLSMRISKEGGSIT